MAEYIEREALKEHLMSYAGMFTDELGFVVKLQAVLNGIDFQPAADVAPVVHGRWHIIVDDYDCEMMRCSCCGAEFYDGDNDTVDSLHNYCPNCGARMDGE